MSGYASLENKKNELVRKGLQGSVFIAPVTADAVDVTTLFDTGTGQLAMLPIGYADLGWTSDTGAVFARKSTSTDVLAWGTNDPIRSDITADVTTLAVSAFETKLLTLSLYSGVDSSSITPAANGTVVVPSPASPVAKFYRVLVVAVDEGDAGEIVLARFLPRAQVSGYDNQSFANTKDPVVWGVTFTAYQDSTLGYAQAQLYGGAGWLGLIDDMGFARTVTCTTATSTLLVATTGTFSASDVGDTVAGAGITAGTTIATYTDPTHVVLSAATTASATGVAVTISE